MEFAVILQPGENVYVVVRCPAIPGCISQGRTREEALANIREAIEVCLHHEPEEGWERPSDGGWELPEFCDVEFVDAQFGYEGFSIVDGKMTDEFFHAEILDNPEANRAMQDMAIERAVARGVAPEVAIQLWGIDEDRAALAGKRKTAEQLVAEARERFRQRGDAI